jgi:hypothetical protein
VVERLYGLKVVTPKIREAGRSWDQPDKILSLGAIGAMFDLSPGGLVGQCDKA